MIWFALCAGWFFLMRVREYAWSNGWGHDKVLTGADVQASVNGCLTSNFREADEMVVWSKASKVDQLKAGEARNHYRSGGPEGLCVVSALEMLQRHHPERFAVERRLPLCRRADGSPVRREHIQEVLEQIAREEGLPADRMRSRSLRIGGAAALYHVCGGVELIKRYGRWASTAFHTYLWESNEGARGLATNMAGDTTTLHVGYRL